MPAKQLLQSLAADTGSASGSLVPCTCGFVGGFPPQPIYLDTQTSVSYRVWRIDSRALHVSNCDWNARANFMPAVSGA